MTESMRMYLCVYCDHPPYKRESAYNLHMARVHTDDAVKLFNRDMTYRQLTRKAGRVAKAIAAIWRMSYSDIYNACYDATIDLTIAGRAVTYRHIRRDAYRILLKPHEVSLDSVLDATDDDGAMEWARSWRGYDNPEAYLMASESLIEASSRLLAAPFDDPDMARWALRIVGMDTFMGVLEGGLEYVQSVNRKKDERRGRPRKGSLHE